MKNTIDLLIVDDNSHARQALTAYLSQQAGVRVAAQASSGLEALTAIERKHPDIVLMDLQMPLMDGLEATRLIKKAWPEIKVIVLTLHPTFEEDARLAGADRFLVKGCSVNEMMEAILELIQDDMLVCIR